MQDETTTRRKRRRMARDGEKVRVPLTLMDGEQRAVAGLNDAAQAQIADAHRNAAEVAKWADYYAAHRDHRNETADPNRAAYLASLTGHANPTGA